MQLTLASYKPKPLGELTLSSTKNQEKNTKVLSQEFYF